MLIAAAFVAAVAAVIDHRTGRIPNWVTLGGLGIGLVGHAGRALLTDGANACVAAVGVSLLGAVVGAFAPLILYRLRALGGGDVKLFAALGALLGPSLGLEAQLLSFLSAALLIPLHLAWRGALLATLRRSLALVANVFRPRALAPAVNEAAMSWYRLGPSIFAGTTWAILAHAMAS